jgi:hypothetical protein
LTTVWMALLGVCVCVGAVILATYAREAWRAEGVRLDAVVAARDAGTDPSHVQPAKCRVQWCWRRSAVPYTAHPSGRWFWVCNWHGAHIVPPSKHRAPV